jgi:hypothetical protein
MMRTEASKVRSGDRVRMAGSNFYVGDATMVITDLGARMRLIPLGYSTTGVHYLVPLSHKVRMLSQVEHPHMPLPAAADG